MAIEKNCFKVSRVDSEFSSRSRESMSSEEEEFPRAAQSDDDDEFDDCDSGAGSDDFDLLELGESGEEFCQIWDQTCSIPLELYDLQGLGDILSMEVWNDCLTEEDRFSLAKYLPDMDQETFMRTLKQLFTGCNFHFGSPISKLFNMLKGGLCEPRVALYRQGLHIFQKRKHYHLLRKHQNSMVTNLYQIRDAWTNCRGYSIEEKLRVLNIVKSQKSIMHEKMEELESDSSDREESADGLWSKGLMEQKLGQKISGFRGGPTLDFPSRASQVSLEPVKYGKQNPKGTLKLAGSKLSTKKELAGRFPSAHHGLEMKSGQYGSALGFDSGAALRTRDQIMGDDDEDEGMYEVAIQKDRNYLRASALDKAGDFKVGRKYEALRGEEYTEGLTGLPMARSDLHAFGRNNRMVNQLSDIKVLTAKPSNNRMPRDYGKKLKYPNLQQFEVDDQIKYGNARSTNLSLKGSQIELADGTEPFWHSKVQGEPFSVDPSLNYNDWNARSKKWKLGRNSPDYKVTDGFHSEYRAKRSTEKPRSISMQNGVKGARMFTECEETESDSSEQADDDEIGNPLMRSKWAYPSGVSDMKAGPGPKKTKLVKKDKKSARAMGEHLYVGDGENYSLKAKQKGKMHDIGHSNNSTIKGIEDSYISGPGWFNGDDQDEIYKMGRNSQLLGRKQKGEVGRNYFVPQATYLPDYIVNHEDDSVGAVQMARDNGVTGRLAKKGQTIEPYDDYGDRSEVQLRRCNSTAKKRKVKDDVAHMDERADNDYLQSTPQQQFDDVISSKKRGKRKLEEDSSNFEKGASETPVIEAAIEDVEVETKPQKRPFTLITPTVHTGFSFSIMHLLSAVRMAMVTLLPEDSLDIGKQKLGEQNIKQEGTNGDLDVNNRDQSGQLSVPSLTVLEIVNRVRSNPGDPCILETQEPLQDLVRGVLKIFSSKTAPLGAKGWKALVLYEKSTKSWSWIGPVAQSSLDHKAVEEVTSPEAWGLPHKMLVKLVDSFANWLKSGQETLQQIGSLPAPPLTLMQVNLDEKERFRDLRAQKSLSTISPTSEEVRDYFRKEEVLRYSIPDRAFSYTAVDGKKSIVAPLRRCGGKPTAKARDHWMLKRERPPHVTILCLVRDAAARLPGSIGTRADVCTLIRDSQYVVEDVTDTQVNQVVSGALDRLHYERDPCVQFDGDRKLWVYLHREREEEDFEDDGTSSTKKWKRQKKEPAEPSDQGAVYLHQEREEEDFEDDGASSTKKLKRQKKEPAEPSDQGAVTVAYRNDGQAGFDLSSDLNAEPLCGPDEEKRVDLVYYDDRNNVEDNVDTSHGSEQEAMNRGPPMVWDSLGLNADKAGEGTERLIAIQENNRLLCQENSTNEDFDDEAFDGEPPA